jgi:hypothetical protein
MEDITICILPQLGVELDGSFYVHKKDSRKLMLEEELRFGSRRNFCTSCLLVCLFRNSDKPVTSLNTKFSAQFLTLN